MKIEGGKKDPRTEYKNEEIIVEGNRVYFDGKYNPETKTLKVYRFRGDISLADQAFQEFAIVNKIEKVEYIKQ